MGGPPGGRPPFPTRPIGTPLELCMRGLSLFTGAMGLDIGLERAGIETVHAVEKDADCRATIAANRPGLPLSSDVTALRPEDLPPCDIIHGGPPCFVAGTLILTDEGYRPIESIKAGETVLTHMGRWRRVTAVMRRRDAHIRKIKAQGVHNLRTTDGHPFFARSMSRHWREGRVFSKPDWIEARHIGTGHFLSQILPKVDRDDHDTRFWWLVGRYLADGWLGDRYNRPNGRVFICSAEHEADGLELAIRKAGFNPYRSRERTAARFEINNVALYKFLLRFGRYAHGKVVPRCALALASAKAKALLEGYKSGDGYMERPPRGGINWRVGSTSKALTLGMALLAQRAYGVVASVSMYRPASKKIIEGRTVNQRARWILNIPQRNRSAFVDGGFGWKKVKKNEPDGREDVYNLAVAGDESYVADGAVVHNCQPFSSAGENRGSSDVRFDPFACMLDLVDAIRPPYVLIENVRGFLAPKHAETKSWVFDRLAAAGYEVTAGLYDAADFGVPQHRQRVLIVGSLSGSVPLMRPTHGPGDGLKPWLTLADAIQGMEPGPHVEFRPSMVKYLKMLKPGENWRKLPPEAQHAALGGAFTSKASKAGGRSSYYRRLPWGRPCPTVLTSPAQKATPLCHPDHVRPLSVAEYAAIQQFPPDWVFKGSLTSQYKQIGNAVPVGLAEAIGRHIVAHASRAHGGHSLSELVNGIDLTP